MSSELFEVSIFLHNAPVADQSVMAVPDLPESESVEVDIFVTVAADVEKALERFTGDHYGRCIVIGVKAQ